MQVFNQAPAVQLAAVMRRIYDHGLTTASGGNISILADNGDIWITPKGIDKGGLAQEDIVCVHPDDSYTGRHEPSTEIAFHRATYRARPDVRAVLHAHPVTCIAFSLTRTVPRVDLTPETLRLCRNTSISKYAMMGSETLAEHLFASFYDGADVVFLENHGVCVCGGDLMEALHRFESIEYAAKLDLLTRKLGSACALTDREFAMYAERLRNIPASACARPVRDTEEKVRTGLLALIRRAYDHALITGSIGACSARLDESSFLITPSGMDLPWLEESDLVVVSPEGALEGKRPAPEWELHRALYAGQQNAAAILSAAPPCVMAFAASNRRLETFTVPESYYMLRSVPRRPIAEMLEDPAAAAAQFGEKTPAVLFEHAGITLFGASLFAALDRLEVAEATAESLVTAQEAGMIVYLSQSEIEDLISAFHL